LDQFLELAGDGDDFKQLMATKHRNVVFTGWIDAPKIQKLMDSSHVALAPYRSSTAFMRSIPIKIFEYMSFGVPIVTSLDGEVRNLVERAQIGKFYAESESNQLVEVIKFLYSNRTDLLNMRRNSSKTFETEFSPKHTFRNRVRFLESICREEV